MTIEQSVSAWVTDDCSTCLGPFKGAKIDSAHRTRTMTTDSDETRDAVSPGSPAHSGYGIASFIMGLAVGGFEFLVALVGGIMDSRAQGKNQADLDIIWVLVGAGVIIGMLMNLGGIVLGVAGFVQKDRRRVFPILGIIVNGSCILALISLVMLGSVEP